VGEAVSILGLDIETAGLVRGARGLDDLDRGARRAAESATGLERAQRRQAAQMSAMAGMAQSLGAHLAAAFSVAAIIRAGDAWISAQNQLRLVTDSARELRDLTQDVFDISQRTASRFEAMSGLYASIQRSAGDAIGSQREVLRITETIAKLAAASGGPESSRAAALFQLRQSLGGAVVQAQEFNSLIDGTPLLVQAIADSLGKTRSELKAMVNDGQLSTQMVIQALQEQADEADALFARTSFTVADAMTRIANAFQRLVGTNLGPVFTFMVNAISTLAENLDKLIPVLAGLGVAVTIAFAPQIIGAFGAAIAGLFTLIAAHPIGALAGALAAAAVAMHQFGGEVVVAQAQIKDFAKSASDEFDKAGKSMTRSIDVTLRDVVEAAFLQLRDVAAATAQSIGANMAQAAEHMSGGAIEAQAFWLQVLESTKAAGNFMIALWETIWDSARVTFSNIGAIIRVGFVEGVNGAIDALEQLLNAMQRLTDPAGLRPEIHLPRIEQDAAAMERLANAGRDFTTSMRENFSRDWLGDLIDGVMERARALASQTEDLLRQFPDYYAAMGAGARAAANEDARALILLRQKVAVMQQLKTLAVDEANIAAQIAAAQISADELDIVTRTQELLRDNAAMYEAIGKGAEKAARAEAERQIANERILEDVTAQAERMREIQRAPMENMLAGWEQTYDDFWTDFSERGFDAFDDLGDAFKDMFQRLQADILRAVFDPVYQAIRSAITQGFDGMGAGAGKAGGGGGVFDLIGSFFNNKPGNGVSDMLGSMKKFDLGNLFGGKGGVMGGLGQIGQGFAYAQIGASIGDAVTNALGIKHYEKNAGIGSMIGGGAGFLLGGPVGAGIGAFLGNVIGGLFGKESNHAATMMADSSGVLKGSYDHKATSETIGAVEAAAARIGEGQQLLRDMGADLTTWISALKLGTRDKSGLALNGQTNIDRYGINSNSVGDPEELAMFALRKVLEGAVFDNGVLNAVNKGMLEAGKPVEAIFDALGKLSDILPHTQEALSQWGQALANLHDVFTDLRIGAEGSASALAAIDGAQREAVASLAKLFRDDIKTQLRALQDPLGAAFAELIKIQTDRLNDAAALQFAGGGVGVNMKKVERLNGVETGAFLDKELFGKLPRMSQLTSEWDQALRQLGDTMRQLITAANDNEAALDQLAEAQGRAVTQIARAFGQSVNEARRQLADPVGFGFDQLLAAQAQRLKDADAIAAAGGRVNMDGVMKLNTLEMRQFVNAALEGAQSLEDLNAVFDKLMSRAQAAGEATAPLLHVFDKIKSGMRRDFNADLADQIAELRNPTLAALRGLLEQQQARLDQARALGANVVAAERLNALEIQDFFKNLSADQKRELGDYLGLIDDFTGKIAVVLTKLNDELGRRIDDVDALREQTLANVETLNQASRAIADVRQGLADRYGAQTPLDSVRDLRARFQNQAALAKTGDVDALSQLPALAQQFIEASRNLYGSTTTFRSDYDMVQQALAGAQESADIGAYVGQLVADGLDRQHQLLEKIRDILQDPAPQLDALARLEGRLDAGNAVVATLLGEYLSLAAQQAGQDLDLQALYQSAIANAGADPFAVNPGAAAPANNNSAAGGANAEEGDDVAGQMLAAQIDVMQEGFTGVRNEVRRLHKDLIKLQEIVAAA
jgi:tape measure domain-containing protein